MGYKKMSKPKSLVKPKKTDLVKQDSKQKSLMFTAASFFMEAATPGSKQEKEVKIIRMVSKALSISPLGVNILGLNPYINKLGLDEKARQYAPKVEYKYNWVQIAKDDTEKAICQCKLVVGEKDLCDWVLGECSPASVKMGTLKGYQNHMAQTRARNRAIYETFGSRMHEELLVSVMGMVEQKESSPKDAQRLIGAVSSSAEEMQGQATESTPEKHGVPSDNTKLLHDLFLYAVSKGATKGTEQKFIEKTLGQKYEWKDLTVQEINTIKTNLMAKTVSRNNGDAKS